MMTGRAPISHLPPAEMSDAPGRTSPGHEATVPHSPPPAGREELEGCWLSPRPTSLASPESQSDFMGGGDSVAQEEETGQSVVGTIEGHLEPECLPPQNENNGHPRGLAGVPVR